MGVIVNDGVLRFSGTKQTLEFLSRIQPFLFAGQKIAQVEAVMRFAKESSRIRGRKRDAEEDERRETLHKSLK